MSAALAAAAVAAFVAVGSFVAFEGLPGGGADSGETTIAIESAAPRAAALTAAPVAGTVAASPAPPSDAAAAEIAAAAPGFVPPGSEGTNSAAIPTPVPVDGGTIGGVPVDPGNPGTVGGGDSPAGPLGAGVDGVQNTAGSLGLDLPLGDLTNDITQPLDRTLRSGLNNVGGTVGLGKLGDTTTNTVAGLLP